jgi:DNA-directed RNA polymerase specialized sigma subunit
MLELPREYELGGPKGIPVPNEFRAPESSFLKLEPPKPVEERPTLESTYEAWKTNPTPESMGSFLAAANRNIESAVRQYAGEADSLSMGYAKRLVSKSLPKFDPSKGSLNTYINRQVQPIQRWSNQRRRVVQLPDRAVAESADVNRISQELEQELGRVPTIEEVADNTGIPVGRVKRLQQSSALVMPSSTTTGDGDDGGLPETLEDSPVEQDTFSAWLNLVRSDLTSTDRLILDYTLGINGKAKKSNAEIAKLLKMSPSAVTQRSARIQSLLDRELELSPFRGN